MIAQPIVRNENLKTRLTVTFSCTNLIVPRSVDEMEAALIKHVLACRHCLAMALYRQETLAESGCDKYRRTLAAMHAELEKRAALLSSEHIADDTLEEHCFNRLSQDASRKLEEHLAVCAPCAKKRNDRLEFIACMRGALQLLEHPESPAN